MIKCLFLFFKLQLYLYKTFETNKRSICGTLVAPDNSNQSNTLISLVSDTPTPTPRCPPLPGRHTHTHSAQADTHINSQVAVYTSVSFHHSAQPPPSPPLTLPPSLLLGRPAPPFTAFVCPLPPSFHRLGPDLPPCARSHHYTKTR